MNTEHQQCLLSVLGEYSLRRKDGQLAIDGIPGPETRGAILRFQKKSGLDPDGIWGPRTQEAAIAAIGREDSPDWWQKYPAVRREDWRCRCGGRFCSGFPAEPREETVALLQKIADHFGKDILWNSGLRCPEYNRRIPGASPNSRHCLGMAYDFHMEGVTPRALADYADSLIPDSGGIGVYPWGIHLDCRREKARW